jgi:hypothetical protein
MVATMVSPDSARFSLRLLEATAPGARYHAELHMASAQWSAFALIREDGKIDFGTWVGGEPPAWLLQYTHAALRDAWRGSSERGWPRRIQRWRAMPAPAGSRKALLGENEGQE